MIVRPLLHDADPYEGIAPIHRPVHGWDSGHPIFRDLMEEFRPSLVVEVGSWVGGSAITMARAAAVLGLETEIVCVDTFLGSVSAEELRAAKAIGIRNGRPLLYETFLGNVVASGHAKRITPFPQTSAQAVRWLRERKIQPDLIYLDAAHDYTGVIRDIADWYGLVPTCAIFGHDYSENHPGVVQAVEGAFPGTVDLSCAPFWIERAP